jgi:predicted nucleotidyltransferase
LRTSKIEKLKRNKIQKALKDAGLSWRKLASTAEQIVLFGSCAAGCDSQDSDVDVLCVGQGEGKRRRGLHLIWIDPHVFNSRNWLKTELGGHVSKYGLWLKGIRSIGPPAAPSRRTLTRKRKAIFDRAEVLNSKWQALSPNFRLEQVRKLRRDLQRLASLRRGRPVPPTPLLDQEWEHQRDASRWLKGLLVNDKKLLAFVRETFRLRAFESA